VPSERKLASLADMRRSRPIVEERSEGNCEVRIAGVCLGRACNMHHRQREGVGPSLPFNLLHLCGSGTTGCHGWIEHNRDEAKLRGWIVPTWEDPELVPWSPA
jgi:hypothetical protein